MRTALKSVQDFLFPSFKSLIHCLKRRAAPLPLVVMALTVVPHMLQESLLVGNPHKAAEGLGQRAETTFPPT